SVNDEPISPTVTEKSPKTSRWKLFGRRKSHSVENQSSQPLDLENAPPTPSFVSTPNNPSSKDMTLELLLPQTESSNYKQDDENPSSHIPDRYDKTFLNDQRLLEKHADPTIVS